MAQGRGEKWQGNKWGGQVVVPVRLLTMIRNRTAERYGLRAEEIGKARPGGTGASQEQKAAKCAVGVARAMGVRPMAIAQFFGRTPQWVSILVANKAVLQVLPEVGAVLAAVRSEMEAKEAREREAVMSAKEKAWLEFKNEELHRGGGAEHRGHRGEVGV